MFVPHWKHSPPLPGIGDSFTVLYVDDVRTSLEAQSSTVWYRGLLYFYYSFYDFYIICGQFQSDDSHVSEACFESDYRNMLYVAVVR
jgi:hypothetical protein